MLKKSWVQRSCLVLAGVATTLLCLYGILWYLVSKGFFVFPLLPPQDCMGFDFSVKGTVTNEQGVALAGAEIHAFNESSFEKPAFNVKTTSDKNGYFETESMFSYACTPFQVEVAAEGYQEQQFTFNPPGEEWPDELPETLNIVLIAEAPEQ